jgi:beta-xylosidase
MKKFILISVSLISFLFSCNPSSKNEESEITPEKSEFQDTPLVTHIYTADPSAHVFEGEIYIYPSHDIENDTPSDDMGGHFDMRDYHVFSMTGPGSEVIDHGAVLKLEDIPWASRQLWAPDAAHKDGKYYFYFPAKDKNDIFRIGVAIADSPSGPFHAQPEPIKGSYSMDPAVFQDDDGNYYLYFGGIWGGQLQWFEDGELVEGRTRPTDGIPAPDQPALMPKVAKLTGNMLETIEKPKDVLIVNKEGNPILSGDNERRFFEGAWVHKYNDQYYLSYSTGDTHNIAYAISDNPYGPFVYQGIVLLPVQGWTNHHSIVQFEDNWYLFYHDTELSGETHLRNIKMAELKHNEDGTIQTINPIKK